jgi:hypothetical protein
VTAGARYLLAEHLVSRRWIGPFLFLLAGIVVLYSQPPNPVLSTAGTVAAWMLPAMSWWCFAFLDTCEPGERQVMTAALGPRRFAAARLLGLAALIAGASLFTFLVPLVLGLFEDTPGAGEIVLVLFADALCGAAGAGLALLISEPIFRGRAFPLLLGVGALVLSIPAGISPAVATAKALDRRDAGAVPGHLAPETLGIALFLAIAIPLAGELWRRRE